MSKYIGSTVFMVKQIRSKLDPIYITSNAFDILKCHQQCQQTERVTAILSTNQSQLGHDVSVMFLQRNCMSLSMFFKEMWSIWKVIQGYSLFYHSKWWKRATEQIRTCQGRVDVRSGDTLGRMHYGPVATWVHKDRTSTLINVYLSSCQKDTQMNHKTVFDL